MVYKNCKLSYEVGRIFSQRGYRQDADVGQSCLQSDLTHTAIPSWWCCGELVWGRKPPALTASFILMLIQGERLLVGGCLVVWLATGGALLLFQVFYSCIVGMSRENTPRCRSRTLTALESGEWREELFVWLGCFFLLFFFLLRMQVDELLVVPLRIWIRKPRWCV